MRIYLISILTILAYGVYGQPIEGKLLGTWSDSTLVPSSAHFNTYNEVWGMAVNGHEYAIIGSTYGTHFIDVTEPTQPFEAFVIKGGSSGPEIIHRDFHDYKGYLYSIADEGNKTTLQIIDTKYLPDSLVVAYDSRSYFSRSHNIFIDTTSARLYSCISQGSDLSYAAMRIFDISDPLDPQVLITVNALGSYGISQVHDVFARNDTAYINMGPHGFAIVDYIDINNPNIITIMEKGEYPQSDYNHSGWPTEDGKYYYMADEKIEKDIKVVDCRSLPDVSFPYTFNASDTEPSIPHNQIVHEGLLYVSYYFHGLQVYDLSDPAVPAKVMYYPTSTEIAAPNLYRGAWGVYPFLPSGNILVSDMQNGLFVIEKFGKGVATHDTDDLSLSIYPNPATDHIYVTTGDAIHNIDLTIMDLSGKVVLTRKVDTGDLIDIGSLASGLYTVTMKWENQIVSKQIVVR